MTNERAGCEEYLYKGMSCCLHPCLAIDCPEPICAIDFPGGIKAYLRYKRMVCLLVNGANLEEAAVEMGVSVYSIKSMFKKRSYIGLKI